MAVTDVDTNSFQSEVLDHRGVVFADFHADWCGPCKMTSPLIEELSEAQKYKEVKFVKIDVDASPELAQHYNIFSIPTFITFKGGTPISQIAGARDRAGFEAELRGAID